MNDHPISIHPSNNEIINYLNKFSTISFPYLIVKGCVRGISGNSITKFNKFDKMYVELLVLRQESEWNIGMKT